MELLVNTLQGNYKVVLKRGLLEKINEYFDFSKYQKIMIISDSGVPYKYIEKVKKVLNNSYEFIFNQGEENKNIDTFINIQKELLKHEFSRKDLLIALGGGVVGDMTGFVASTYKRGIDYINIPTTSLSQIDSSIGGKTAIDFEGVKNVIGSFYQPKAVLIDFDTLKTLDEYQLNSGLVEALKAGIIKDTEIITLFADYKENIEEIIYRALKVKQEIVEIDVYENNERRYLNLGHTIGHAIESLTKVSHGEAICLGLRYAFYDLATYYLIEPILESLNLKTRIEFDKKKALELLSNDKKAQSDGVNFVFVKELGEVEVRKITIEEIESLLEV